MKEKAIAKINKVGHIGNIITKIAKICLIIGFVGLLIGEAVMLWMPSNLFNVTVSSTLEGSVNMPAAEKMIHVSDINKTVEEALKTGNASMEINDEDYIVADIKQVNDSVIFSGTGKSPKSVTVNNLRIASGLGLLLIACTYVLFLFICKLCTAIETCETPFGEEVIKSLNNFAYALVAYVIVEGTLSSLVTGLAFSTGSINIGINGTSILVALAVYVLTVIFKYGAILQKESDETL